MSPKVLNSSEVCIQDTVTTDVKMNVTLWSQDTVGRVTSFSVKALFYTMRQSWQDKLNCGDSYLYTAAAVLFWLSRFQWRSRLDCTCLCFGQTWSRTPRVCPCFPEWPRHGKLPAQCDQTTSSSRGSLEVNRQVSLLTSRVWSPAHVINDNLPKPRRSRF